MFYYILNVKIMSKSLSNYFIVHPVSLKCGMACMLNLQEPWFDHLTASAQPWPIVFSSTLFTFGLYKVRFF